MSEFKHVTYGLGFVTQEGQKIYGKVKRNGRIFYRNYHRPIKGGISGVELFIKKVEMEENRLREMVGTTLFHKGNSI